MKVMAALLMGGAPFVQPTVLSSERGCIAPVAVAQTVDGVTLIDSDTVHWRSGLPPGLSPTIGQAPWFRADAYAHASSRDSGPVDLIQSTLLQGMRQGAYRQLRSLYVLCGQGAVRTACLYVGLDGTAHFADLRTGKPEPVKVRSDLAAKVPLARPTAFQVTRRRDALLIAAISNAGPRANRDRDVYLVSAETGSVRLQCRCRTGSCVARQP